jgi:opacity protein-like surface antigen
MKQHFTVRILLASLLISGLVTAAQGQSRQGRFEVEPLVGYTSFGHVEEGPRYSLDLHSEPSVGVRVGYGVGTAFTVELEYSHTETGLILDGPFGFSADDLHDLTIDSVLVSGTLHLTRGRFVPYVTLGGGVAHIDSAVQHDLCLAEICPLTVPIFPPVPHEETRPTVAAGLGVKAALSDRLGLRLDARGYALNQGDTRFIGGFGTVGEREEWLTSATASVGLLYAF